MRLHVLAGPAALLGPLPPPPAALAALIGGEAGAQAPGLRVPAAPWLAAPAAEDGTEPGDDPPPPDHAALLAGADERRLDVFAAALRENFGRRCEPLLLLPAALGPDGAAAEASRATLAALWRRRPAAALRLHALALPAAADGGAGWVAAVGLDAAAAQDKLAALRAGLGTGAEAAAIDVAVHAPAPAGPDPDKPDPAEPLFALLLRNALAREAAARAGPPLAAAGLAPGPDLVPAAARRLAAWAGRGLLPALPLDAAGLDRLAARLVAALVAEGSPDA